MTGAARVEARSVASTTSPPTTPLVSAEEVSVTFKLRRDQELRAVTDVSFEVFDGETLGLVGESGCGKSTLGRVVAGLLPASGGTVRFRDQAVTQMSKDRRKALHAEIQMVFQDPSASFDPRMSIWRSLEEPLRVHRRSSRSTWRDQIDAIVEQVGLLPRHVDRYVHELSGGQLQRLNLARALLLQPALMVCDEILSSLDVAVQAQVLNLLDDLQDELGLTYLFISHDIAVVAHATDRVAVMYLGRIVEIGPSAEVLERPKHPYTAALLSANPQPVPRSHRSNQRIILQGDLPSPIDPPSGCAFRTRCPFAVDACAESVPQLRAFGAAGQVACHRAEEIAAGAPAHNTRENVEPAAGGDAP